VVSADGVVLYDLGTRRELGGLAVRSAVLAVAFTPTVDRHGAADGGVTVWAVDKSREADVAGPHRRRSRSP
jgi:hypothetical protein